VAYHLCVFGDVDDLVKQVFCDVDVGGQRDLEETSYPPRKLSNTVAFHSPGDIDYSLNVGLVFSEASEQADFNEPVVLITWLTGQSDLRQESVRIMDDLLGVGASEHKVISASVP